MEKKDLQAGRVDEVMESLDGIKRADPGPWFFSRLSAKLVHQQRSIWFSVGSFLSRPAVAVSGIMGILLLNMVLLLNEQKEVKTVKLPQVVTENEYVTASNSSFDYENLVQP
ncbi:MAG: hypothetical protein EOO05_05015 [Chitinophagaceae bacterium]|nr:MAG: hypothetical protein EOO05_05015 [Chitinophagaceae bacterium]